MTLAELFRMTTLTVRVTQQHIDAGIPAQARHCPIALAIGEIPNTRFVFVTKSEIETDSAFYEPSRRARAFIDAFDEGGANAVQPTTFRFTRFA